MVFNPVAARRRCLNKNQRADIRDVVRAGTERIIFRNERLLTLRRIRRRYPYVPLFRLCVHRRLNVVTVVWHNLERGRLVATAVHNVDCAVLKLNQRGKYRQGRCPPLRRQSHMAYAALQVQLAPPPRRRAQSPTLKSSCAVISYCRF